MRRSVGGACWALEDSYRVPMPPKNYNPTLILDPDPYGHRLCLGYFLPVTLQENPLPRALKLTPVFLRAILNGSMIGLVNSDSNTTNRKNRCDTLPYFETWDHDTQGLAKRSFMSPVENNGSRLTSDPTPRWYDSCPENHPSNRSSDRCL